MQAVQIFGAPRLNTPAPAAGKQKLAPQSHSDGDRQQRIARLREKINNMSYRLEQARYRRDQKRNQLGRLNNEIERLENENDQLYWKINNLQDKFNSVEAKRNAAQRKRNWAQDPQERARWQAEVDRLNAILFPIFDKLQAAKNRKMNITNAINDKRWKVSDLQMELSDMNRRIEAGEQRLQQLRDELARLENGWGFNSVVV